MADSMKEGEKRTFTDYLLIALVLYWAYQICVAIYAASKIFGWKKVAKVGLAVFLFITIAAVSPIIGLGIFVAGSAYVVKKWYTKHTASQREIAEVAKDREVFDREFAEWSKEVHECQVFVEKYIIDNHWFFLTPKKREEFYKWLEGDEVDPTTGQAHPYKNMRGYEKFVQEYDEVDRIMEMQHWCSGARLCYIDGSPVSSEVERRVGTKNN